MMAGDDRQCTVNSRIDGEGKLREAVEMKLKEFLGDYTDDTLVEYVIVLLKNGRGKEQAKNELHVFLGDDSDSFITWLWDHLGSNLHLYSQFVSSIQSNKVVCAEPAIHEPVAKLDSENVEGRSNKFSKPRHRRQWKGLAGDVEHHILKSFITESDSTNEDSHRMAKATQPHESLHEGPQRKRLRTEASGSSKVLSTSVACGSKKIDRLHEAAITVPRRLLQIAVLDAVRTVTPPVSVMKPSLKKAVPEADWSLHNSEQPYDFGDDLPDGYVRPLDEVNVHSSYYDYFKEQYALETAFLARDSDIAPESGFECDGYNDMEIRARDVEASFYDDFKGHYVSDTLLWARDNELAPEYGYEYDGYDDRESRDKDVHSSYYDDFKEQYVSDTSFLARDIKMAPKSGFEYDEYYDMEIRGRGFKNVSTSSKVAIKKVEDSLKLSYGADNNNDGRSRKAFSFVCFPDASHKIVTCNSPQYREARENTKRDSNRSKSDNKALDARLNLPSKEANTSSAVRANGNVKRKPSIVKESHKMQLSTHGRYSTSEPTDDADSRSIFISNVHFAATKDSISWHFNKFGEVLKVNILSDPATRLPKGSAYVKFMRKDSAEHALALDGTSFMSRILKVIKKSLVPLEASCTVKWPRSARSFPYPRGSLNVYRARPLKPFAKSLQWKRDTQSIPNQMPNLASNTIPSAAAPRSLTYVRPDPKTNGSSNKS